MKIGVHPSNLHLTLARLMPEAFALPGVEFIPYPEGRDTAKFLDAGVFDFGGTGSTPPIIASAAGLEVVYIAASAPRPANGGIFVRAGSDIRSVADLRGRRITLVDGSFHTYLLARVLEDAGLLLPDVTRVEVPAADSLAALLDGRVDAWIAMAPRLESALERDDLRLILRCGETIPNRSLFWTLAGRGLDAAARTGIAAALAEVGRRVTADPRAAAEKLALAGDASTDAWERIIRSRDFTILHADAAILAEQQRESDTLLRHGYLDAAQIIEKTGDAA